MKEINIYKKITNMERYELIDFLSKLIFYVECAYHTRYYTSLPSDKTHSVLEKLMNIENAQNMSNEEIINNFKIFLPLPY